MTLHAIFVAIVLAGVSCAAMAGNPAQTTGSTSVAARQKNIAKCRPPNGNMGRACDNYDQWLRSNFTLREIGMLFGCQSAYPEYVTGGTDRLEKRYNALLRQYIAGHPPTATPSMARR